MTSSPLCSPALEASWSLEVAAEPQGSEAGVELEAQGSVFFKGGTEGGAPHGSTGAAGLGAEPEKGWRHIVLKSAAVGHGCMHYFSHN